MIKPVEGMPVISVGNEGHNHTKLILGELFFITDTKAGGFDDWVRLKNRHGIYIHDRYNIVNLKSVDNMHLVEKIIYGVE